MTRTDAHRVARPPRPARSVRSRAIIVAATLGLLTGVALLPTSGAKFTANVGNSASMASASLASPTSLSASQRCPIPSVVAAVTADEAGGVIGLVVPAAAAVGDLLIAQLVNDNPTTPPPGWSVLNQITAAANLESTLYQRVATAGDPNQLYSFVDSGSRGVGSMLVVRNASGLVATTDAAGLDNDNTAVITAPSVTTTTQNSLLISFFGQKSGGQSFSTPSGMTESYDFGGFNASLAADYQLRASTGATGARTATASSAATSVAQSVAVARANRPEVDLTWTPTVTAWATGHEIERNAAVVATVSPRTTSTWTDTSPGSGSTSFHVSGAFGNWRSPRATTTLTVGCS